MLIHLKHRKTTGATESVYLYLLFMFKLLLANKLFPTIFNSNVKDMHSLHLSLNRLSILVNSYDQNCGCPFQAYNQTFGYLVIQLSQS